MLVICFALSGIPPWNNHQSQRLLMFLKGTLQSPGGLKEYLFSLHGQLSHSATPYRSMRDLFWKQTYSIYFFLPDCQA